MPNRDGSGPDGNGPNTGRGVGPCTSMPAGQVLRRGLGRGFGRRRI